MIKFGSRVRGLPEGVPSRSHRIRAFSGAGPKLPSKQRRYPFSVHAKLHSHPPGVCGPTSRRQHCALCGERGSGCCYCCHLCRSLPCSTQGFQPRLASVIHEYVILAPLPLLVQRDDMLALLSCSRMAGAESTARSRVTCVAVCGLFASNHR